MDAEKKLLSAGLRPALLYKSIGLNFDQLDQKLLHLTGQGAIANQNNLKNSILGQMIDLLDELWSPIIAYEIAQASHKSKNAEEGYVEFFLDERCAWKNSALNIYEKHRIKTRPIGNLARNVYLSINRFLDTYSACLNPIEKHLNTKPVIIELDLKASDTHNGGAFSIIVTFAGGKKLVFKPKPAANDEFIAEIVETLQLPENLKPGLPKIVASGPGYFWSDFVEHERHNTKKNLAAFYKNAGGMLALMDSLNFSDGHHENFVSGIENKLYLVDAETILINLSYFDGKLDSFYDVSFTGMIEDKEQNKSYISALQANESFFNYPVTPTIINDLTTEMSIKYNTVQKNIYAKSSPIQNAMTIQSFKDQCKEGARTVYESIAKADVSALLEILERYSDSLALRQIKRHTLYYQWLIHRMAHPMNNEKNKFIDENMRNYPAEIVAYELRSLDQGDIPVFYHKPAERHLYGCNDELVLKDWFSKPAQDWFKQKITDLQNPDFINQRISRIDALLSAHA